MPSALPISRIIGVSVNLAAVAAQAQSLSDLLILGPTPGIFNANELMRTYSSLTDVSVDFGPLTPEYLAAQAWFNQRPQPTQLLIGKSTAAASLLLSVQLYENQFPGIFYGLVTPGAIDADTLAVAGFIEGAGTKHLYGVNSKDPNTLVANDATCIAAKLKALGYMRTLVQFSTTNDYAVSSLMGRKLTVDYDGNSTSITLFYKDEPGVVAELLTVSQIVALEAKNANVFAAYNNDTAIIEPGKVASGEFVDVVTDTDALAIEIQTAIYNRLYTSPTKIPQTDQGMHLLLNTTELILAQFVANGVLAPGVWTSDGFGALNTGDFLQKGYYTYVAPVATQSDADRAARKAVPIQVAAKLAGAVHTSNVIINVNR